MSSILKLFSLSQILCVALGGLTVISIDMAVSMREKKIDVKPGQKLCPQCRKTFRESKTKEVTYFCEMKI